MLLPRPGIVFEGTKADPASGRLVNKLAREAATELAVPYCGFAIDVLVLQELARVIVFKLVTVLVGADGQSYGYGVAATRAANNQNAI